MLTPGQHVHFVGIGGSGLSAIARVMLERGFRVSGSDRQLNDLTAALARDGAAIYAGHRPEHIGDAALLIISSAIPADNPEVLAARARGLPVLKRSDILAELMAGQIGVAVAGTHGKTTTTAMIVHILRQTGRDPSFIVGGIVPGVGTNAGVGQGAAFVIEADEYDHMFLGLRPALAVITSIEHDHPDLFPTLEALVDAFRRFAALIPPDGLLVACADDPGAGALAAARRSAGGMVTTYGVASAEAGWRAVNVRAQGGGMAFDVLRAGRRAGAGRLRVPGAHNVLNALAALAIVERLGVAEDDALAALATFSGAARRFEVRGQAGGVTVIDDYGHHPTAITATLRAARAAYPQAAIWAVWQPHTYSRLRALFEGFAAAFPPEAVDHVLITDVYAAREAISDGPGVPALIARIPHPDVRHTPTFDAAVEALAAGAKPGDVVLILSAGDAPAIGIRLLERLGRTR